MISVGADDAITSSIQSCRFNIKLILTFSDFSTMDQPAQARFSSMPKIRLGLARILISKTCLFLLQNVMSFFYFSLRSVSYMKYLPMIFYC